jgi:hypothetical protein
LCHVFSTIAHTGSYLPILNMLFNDSEPLLVIILTDWNLRLDVVHIFLDAMQLLDLGLTPCNEISWLTLPQLQWFGYCSFYLTLVLIGCRSNIINYFHIYIAPPWLLMSCSLFEKSIYSFHMTVLIHNLCNVLSTIMMNSLACWFLSSKIWSLKYCPYT